MTTPRIDDLAQLLAASAAEDRVLDAAARVLAARLTAAACDGGGEAARRADEELLAATHDLARAARALVTAIDNTPDLQPPGWGTTRKETDR